MTKESDKQKGKRKNETQLGKKAWKSDKPRSKKKKLSTVKQITRTCKAKRCELANDATAN